MKQNSDSLSEAWLSSTQPLTDQLSILQLVWICLQGLGSAGICFGVNYGLAIISFKSKPPPTLWYFPLPIAGYYGVITVLEVLLNWLICGTLQSLDVKNGIVPPLNPAILWWWPKEPKYLWWMNISDLVIPNSISLSHRFFSSMKRSIPWMLFSFLFLWPLFTGISYAIWGNNGYNSFPQPEFMVATYGGALGLLVCPMWAVLTLANMGDKIMKFKSSVSSSLTKDDISSIGVRMSDLDPISPPSLSSFSSSSHSSSHSSGYSTPKKATSPSFSSSYSALATSSPPPPPPPLSPDPTPSQLFLPSDPSPPSPPSHSSHHGTPSPSSTDIRSFVSLINSYFTLSNHDSNSNNNINDNTNRSCNNHNLHTLLTGVHPPEPRSFNPDDVDFHCTCI